MREVIVYSSDDRLEKLIRRKKLIPYQITPGDKFIKNKWYYDVYYDSLFKVTEVRYKNNNILDYAITKSDKGYQNYISTPPIPYEDYYIEYDRSDILNTNIINSEKSYTGAEIRYWFFMKNITCFDAKYKYFWTYVDTYSKNKVADRQKYYLYAGMKDDIYIHCRVFRDNGNVKKPSFDEYKEFDEYMKEQKEKDLHNTKLYHEVILNEQETEEEMGKESYNVN